ncbi:MAG: hypothetical protein AB1540_02420 [Bdellovibrionota bacterium]
MLRRLTAGLTVSGLCLTLSMLVASGNTAVTQPGRLMPSPAAAVLNEKQRDAYKNYLKAKSSASEKARLQTEIRSLESVLGQLTKQKQQSPNTAKSDDDIRFTQELLEQHRADLKELEESEVRGCPECVGER